MPAECRSTRKGFALIVVVIFAGVIMACSALAIQVAETLFEENVITAKRLKVENAAVQASDLAEAWFRTNIGDIADGAFSVSADVSEAPEHSPSSSLFTVLENEYPDYSFSCRIFDLYYADSYSDTAEDEMLPFIAPIENDDGEIERAYIQKVTVDPGGSSLSYTHTRIFRAVKNTSGDISVISVGYMD